MATVNELLRDAALSHEIDLAQYSAGVARRLIAILNRTDTELAAQLAAALDDQSADSFTVHRLEALLASVRKLNLRAYQQIERELTEELKRFVPVEANYHEQLWQRTIPGEIQVRYRVAAISPNQVYAAAMARPFQGRLLRDWAKQLPVKKIEYVRNAVRQGYLEGKTVADIVRGIRGTRALKYADGTLNRSRRELETVVRAAVQHTAATAREKFEQANADLLAAVAWSSTLDTKTSTTCRVRDGRKYTAVEHKPIGHKIPWGAGPGKIHWNCRSSSQPVTKSWRELGFEIDEVSPGTRASMDGQVPAEIKYADWLKRQPAFRQDEVVGATRGRLMRAGKLDLDDMYSPRGQWLSLEQLEQRHESAFSRAGL